MKWPCKEKEFCKLKEFEEKKGEDAKIKPELEDFPNMINHTPEKYNTRNNCLVMQTRKIHILCVHKKGALPKFEQALLQAHESAEAFVALDATTPLALGQKVKGVVFVAKEAKATGEIEVKESELDFVGSDPPLILKYKDVAEQGGDICAVKITKGNIDIDDAALEANGGLDRACCMGLKTKSSSDLVICLDASIPDCPMKMKELAHQVRKTCTGNQPSKSERKDLEADTND